MVSPITEGIVQLAGKGYVNSRSHLWGPGEYKRLRNVDITDDGRLVNRDPSVGVKLPSPAPAGVGPDRFIGNLGRYPVLNGYGVSPSLIYNKATSHPAEFDYQRSSISYTGSLKTIVNAAAGNIAEHYDKDNSGAANGGFTFGNPEIVGVFWYNDYLYYIVATVGTKNFNKNYALIVTIVRTLDMYSMDSAYVSLPDLVTIDEIRPNFIPLNTQMSSIIYYDTLQSRTDRVFHAPQVKVPRHFIHKERLWLYVGDTVYFSKATNPGIFTVPDGGFFKFPGSEIKDIIAVNDVVYVLTDNQIFMISYNNDPNLDAEVVLVSEHIGADAGVAVGDQVYCYKQDALYILNGRSYTKAAQLDLRFPGLLGTLGDSDATTAQQLSVCMASYKDSLLLLFRRVHRDGHWWGGRYECLFDTPPDISTLYKISLSNGSVSEYDLGKNTPCDMQATPVESLSNHSPVFVLDNDWNIGDAGIGDYGINVLGPVPAVPDGLGSLTFNYFVDAIWNRAAGVMSYRIPEMDIQIPTISPDNLRYFMKKFRHLMIEADLPYQIVTDTWVEAAPHGGTNGTTEAGVYSSGTITVSQLIIYQATLSLTMGLDSQDPSGVAYSSVLLRELDNTANSNWYKGSATYRYPINQRAKEIGIRIHMPQFNVPTSAVPYSMNNFYVFDATTLEISDIRSLWTYTGRAPVGYNSDKA